MKSSLFCFDLKRFCLLVLKGYMGMIDFLFLNYSWLNFERRGIVAFLRFASLQMSAGGVVLDAGAGQRPYRKLLKKCGYESCDVSPAAGSHDFYCDLSTGIPKENRWYDSVICTQVLEHLPDPQKALLEFNRVLKPGGQLFLTVPQGGPLHEEPNHYFNFTRYGMEMLFRKSGFSVGSIAARGGYFEVLGYRCMNLLRFLLSQKKVNGVFALSMFALYPFLQFLLGFLIPLLCKLFSPLDHERKLTLGYNCHCRKQSESISSL